MTDSYVPIEELAQYLSVKAKTIRQWIAKGYIPSETYIKVGYTYRFSIPQVVAALKQEAPPTEDKLENEPVQQKLDFCEEDDL